MHQPCAGEWLGSQRDIAASRPPSPGSVGPSHHTGISHPEQQRRKGEPKWYWVVGISEDSIRLEDSDHINPGEEWFLCYNISRRVLEGPGAVLGPGERVCSVYPPVTLRGPLLSGRTLGREPVRQTRLYGLGKRTGLTHFKKTCGVPPPPAGLSHCVPRQGGT